MMLQARLLRGALGRFEVLIVIALIILGTAIAIRAASAVIGRALGPRGDRLLDETRRRTLQPLLESLVRYVFVFIAFVMILRQLNVDATAILASAGVLGFAVGFGAQSLIRDLISGFFLLSEGLIRVGDTIVFDGRTGVVERVSIRTTLVREFSGALWTIPNGQLQVFANRSRGFLRAIVETSVAYEADIEKAMQVMHAAGDAWAAEQHGTVLSPPQVEGIVQFGDAGATIRLVITLRPQDQLAAELDLRRRIKAAFDHEGIAMLTPRRMTLITEAGGSPGPAPPASPPPPA